jgi:hypothetical protein
MMQVTKSETKELTTAELQARLSALMRELQIEDGMVNRKYTTMASIEAVSAELQRKRAQGGDDGSGSPMENMYL